jgi:peptidyl-prolyl cis-trans isomerase SurA
MKYFFRIISVSVAITLSLYSYSEKVVLDKIAAIAGDGIVLESELNEQYDLYLINFKNNNPDLALPPESLVKEQLLERAILIELQLQRAKRAGVRISDQELAQSIARIASNNNTSLEDFIKKIELERSFETFRRDIRQQLILSRVQRGLVGPKVFISDQELLNFIASTEGQNLILVEYKIKEILVNSEVTANFIKEKINKNIDFSSLSNEYNEGDKVIEIPWVKLGQLPSLFADEVQEMTVGSIRGPIKSGAGYHFLKVENKRGDTVRIEDQSLARHILIQTSEIRNKKQATTLINEIKDRISKGEEFSVMARLYSDDPGTKLDGGELGWSISDVFDPEFKRILDASELNVVSEPFESSFGFHILEVLDRRKEDVSGELLKNKAYQIIYERKFEEQLDKTLQELRAEAFVEIKLNS